MHFYGETDAAFSRSCARRLSLHSTRRSERCKKQRRTRGERLAQSPSEDTRVKKARSKDQGQDVCVSEVYFFPFFQLIVCVPAVQELSSFHHRLFQSRQSYEHCFSNAHLARSQAHIRVLRVTLCTQSLALKSAENPGSNGKARDTAKTTEKRGARETTLCCENGHGKSPGD